MYQHTYYLDSAEFTDGIQPWISWLVTVDIISLLVVSIIISVIVFSRYFKCYKQGSPGELSYDYLCRCNIPVIPVAAPYVSGETEMGMAGLCSHLSGVGNCNNFQKEWSTVHDLCSCPESSIHSQWSVPETLNLIPPQVNYLSLPPNWSLNLFSQ